MAELNNRIHAPRSPHSLVFRAIDQAIRRDRTASRVFRTIRSWRGADDDGTPPAPDACPALLLTPGQDGEEWYGPGSFRSRLVIECEACAVGTHADDPMDLVHVIRRALYPADPDAGLAIQRALVAAGADTGEPEIGAPQVAIVMGKEPPKLTVCTFSIQIVVRMDINP